MTTVPSVAVPRVPAVPDTLSRKPRGSGRRRGVVALFMAPAALLLGAVVVYPTIATFARSLYDDNGFVGAGNYKTMFGTADILVAIRNNAIWVIVFPFLVTFLGLVFAVLTERIRWATAFKTIVFMPMAISLFATGVIWRIVYETDPNRGVLNAAVGTVANAIHPPGFYALPNIKPISGLTTAPDGGMVSTGAVAPGSALLLGLTGIPPTSVPPAAQVAQPPSPAGGSVTGLVWRDFSIGGHVSVVDPGEKGLPAMRVDLLAADGHTVANTTTLDNGAFRFDSVSGGSYHVELDAANFRQPFGGVSWWSANRSAWMNGSSTASRSASIWESSPPMAS